MLHDIGHWLEKHLTIPGIPWWASLIITSVLLSAISIVVSMVAVIFIPENYFVGSKAPDWVSRRHPVLRWTLRILRNILGWALIVLGILLSLPGIPGQGLLTVLLGLMLTEFPGKRRLEKRLVRQSTVRKTVDRIRARFGAKPLVLEEDERTGKS